MPASVMMTLSACIVDLLLASFGDEGVIITCWINSAWRDVVWRAAGRREVMATPRTLKRRHSFIRDGMPATFSVFYRDDEAPSGDQPRARRRRCGSE